ncbi:MAG TPA: hypothetical protein VNZ52_13635 [Candidatus Thermoplasmatota archaeon]|nr:hypothetical protein [Candidatus Thermoplasmatota archaeon]
MTSTPSKLPLVVLVALIATPFGAHTASASGSLLAAVPETSETAFDAVLLLPSSNGGIDVLPKCTRTGDLTGDFTLTCVPGTVANPDKLPPVVMSCNLDKVSGATEGFCSTFGDVLIRDILIPLIIRECEVVQHSDGSIYVSCRN